MMARGSGVHSKARTAFIAQRTLAFTPGEFLEMSFRLVLAEADAYVHPPMTPIEEYELGEQCRPESHA